MGRVTSRHVTSRHVTSRHVTSRHVTRIEWAGGWAGGGGIRARRGTQRRRGYRQHSTGRRPRAAPAVRVRARVRPGLPGRRVWPGGAGGPDQHVRRGRNGPEERHLRRRTAHGARPTRMRLGPARDGNETSKGHVMVTRLARATSW